MIFCNMPFVLFWNDLGDVNPLMVVFGEIVLFCTYKALLSFVFVILEINLLPSLYWI